MSSGAENRPRVSRHTAMGAFNFRGSAAIRSSLRSAARIVGFLALCACSEGPKPAPVSIPSATAGGLPDRGSAGAGASALAGLSTPDNSGFLVRPPPVVISAPPAPACDANRSVDSTSPALIVRDADVLARFALERVLGQIIATARSGDITPLELLQRLFDNENTREGGVFENNPHCDDPPTRSAFVPAPVLECPRAEGRLAKSDGLLRAGDPDFFAPVAIVNRFDLMPSDYSSCGEYRIVYAKASGLTNPEDRVMLILEGALPNPSHTLWGCKTVADVWAGLATAPSLADSLEKLFFQGVDGGLAPVIHADHYGLRNRHNCEYSGLCGQFRVGEGMQAPWRFRQFRLLSSLLDSLVPLPDRVTCTGLCLTATSTTSTPRAEFFDPTSKVDGVAAFQSEFLDDVRNLDISELARMRLSIREDFEAFESAVEGPAQPNYASRVGSGEFGVAFKDQIAKHIGNPVREPPVVCPTDDPLTPDRILQRAEVQTCAGCHAPQVVLGADRAIGCGQVWPESLGRVHIDERGELSDALTHTFLPHRARVLSVYLQGCDLQAIERNLIPVRVTVHPECFAAGTRITMADGSERLIEQVVAGDQVLAFDEESRALVAAVVERAIVRPDVDRLIVINDALVTTPNHQFYTTGGLKRAQALTLGDPLYELRTGDSASELAAARVERLAARPGGVETYNLEIAVHHNYFAGGVLVSDKR